MQTVSSVVLRELERADLGRAAQVLGRGMCENPANIRVFGIAERARRSRALARFFGAVFRGLYRRGSIYGAFHDEALVGVCCMARPGLCQPGTLEKLTVVPSVMLGHPFGTTARVLRWTGEWARRDPREPHWHLGPVAVDSHLQGQGIGSAMLASFCAQMDACGALSYLETDKRENVDFYRRFGFSVAEQAAVMGVPNWFMSRPALR